MEKNSEHSGQHQILLKKYIYGKQNFLYPETMLEGHVSKPVVEDHWQWAPLACSNDCSSWSHVNIAHARILYIKKKFLVLPGKP